MTSSLRLVAVLCGMAWLCGCGSEPRHASAAPVDSLTLRPGYLIDSVFPMDEMLRRFRANLGPAPSTLEDAPASRDELVRELVRALAQRDSAALGRLHLSRGEFAWMYFPTSRFASPPYELPPEVLWMQMTAESNKSIARTLRGFPKDATYLGHACDATPGIEGANRLWTGCLVRWRRRDGGEGAARLFGTILERDGRYKFVSYANGD